LSFWDALIVRSARAGGCSVVFSEDLKHGQTYEGVLIENPFSR
jgi:predicted nucleic acid-binding protein